MIDPVSIAAVGWGISTAGWLVSPIISKLINKCLSYLGICSSDKLHKLESKILELQLMLQAVQDSPEGDKLWPWMKKLKSAFHEAEDIIDTIDYQHIRSRIIHRNVANTRKVVKVKDEFSVPVESRKKLNQILETIEELIADGHRFLSLLNLPVNYENINSRSKNNVRSTCCTTSAPPDMVFGRDEDIQMMRTMLRDTAVDDDPSSSRTKCYSVIGLYGIAGSGKTTIAQGVCEKEREEGYFNLVMWIHVSQNFSIDTIFTEMLEIASDRKKYQLNNLDILQRELEAELKGKRFLLILDDVWCHSVSELQLDLLHFPLTAGERGSRILVTTRNADAARAFGAQNPVSIPVMDKDQFFSMFMHYALGYTKVSDRSLLKEYEYMGRKISEKLGRSPLAARTVAGLLRICQDINFWRRTLNRDLLNDTMGALWWSYQQLDEHIKQCFSYCSMFPRRHKIRRDHLVHLWMAQGFLDTTDGTEDLEDVGDEYFRVLLSCSFIRPTGDSNFFTIHDLLHDLAERISGSDCFRIEEGMEHRIPRDVQHLFMQYYESRIFTEQTLNLGNLRTLYIDDFSSKGMPAEDLEGLLKGLKKVRVLQLNFRASQTILLPLPACIGQMKHLRYLSLMGCSVIILVPPEIGMLHHLQQFDVLTRIKFDFSSENEMSNLVSLRNIVTIVGFTFPNIGRLTMLRRLPAYRVQKAEGYEIQELEHLNNLQGNISISGLETVESKEKARQAKLDKKMHISDLSLEWYYSGDQSSNLLLEKKDSQKSKRPRWTRTARHCGFVHERPCDPPDEILEALCPPSSIRTLSIRNYSGLRYPSWLSGEQGKLDSLQFLTFSNWHGSNAPPKISTLDFHSLCIDMCSWNSLPENIENLTSLKQLIIRSCKNIMSLSRLPPSLEKLCMIDWDRPDAPAGIGEFAVNLHSLEFVSCSWNSLPRNMERLMSLEELRISGCENIRSLQWVPVSLKKLTVEIYFGSNVPPAIDKLLENLDRLMSLEELTIRDFKNLLSPPAIIDRWTGSAAPAEITLLVNLCKLEVRGCSWNSLPKGMDCLSSLKELRICSCKNISSLPRLPMSLEYFELSCCDRNLMDYCKTDGHPYWHNIAHIATKIIG